MIVYYTLQYCDAFKCTYVLKYYYDLTVCLDGANIIVEYVKASAWCISNVYMKGVM